MQPGKCKARAAAVLMAAVLSLVPASLPASDSVQLRSGELFTGKVLRVNKEEVSIQLESGGVVTFRSSQVHRVRRWLPFQSAPEVITFKEETGEPEGGEGPVSPPGSAALRDNREGKNQDDDSGPETGAAVPEPFETPFRFEGVSPVKLLPPETRRGWSLTPPPGFEEWSPRKSAAEVIRAWKDPSSQSTIALMAYRSGGSPEKIKQAISKKLQKISRFRVIRDLPFQKGGREGYRGWLLELEREHADVLLRQILLLAGRGDDIYLLCFTAPASEYTALADPFETSLDSFNLLTADLGPAPASPPTPAAGPAGDKASGGDRSKERP